MRSAFGGRFIEAGQKPAIAALSACGIALYLAYHLTRFQVSAVWPLAPRGDASIVFDQAHAILCADSLSGCTGRIGLCLCLLHCRSARGSSHITLSLSCCRTAVRGSCVG